MRTYRRAFALVVLAGTVLTGITFAQGRGQRGFGGDDAAGIAQVLQGVPQAPLSAAEKAGLFLMREEEELARDVYTHSRRSGASPCSQTSPRARAPTWRR